MSDSILSEKAFRQFGDFIVSEIGIKMPPSKRSMLESRLKKRMRKLGFEAFDAYRDYVFSPEGRKKEIFHLLDVVTTNKTDFFREPKHYDILVQKILPDLLHPNASRSRRPLTLWSAGCSTGAEPYTLSMVLSEFAERVSGFRFRILATDVSTQVLEKAKMAVYEEKEAAPVPAFMKKKYLLRSKDRLHSTVRIVPELRKCVEFRRLNFMEDRYGLDVKMDIVFCRNVIIYFDRSTQEAVLEKICRQIRSDGYLFMGHSETLTGFDLPLRQVATTVYQKAADWQ